MRALVPSDHPERYGAPPTLLAGTLISLLAGFGLLLQQVVQAGPVARADTAIVEGLTSFSCLSGVAAAVSRAASLLGSGVWLALLVTAGCVYCLVRRRERLAGFLLVTWWAGELVNTAVKAAVDRPRPALTGCELMVGSASFPSGHALNSMVVYGALLVVAFPLVRRRLSWLVAGVTVLLVSVGFSRLTLGVHYPSDVLAGWLLGALVVVLSAAAWRAWPVRR